MDDNQLLDIARELNGLRSEIERLKSAGDMRGRLRDNGWIMDGDTWVYVSATQFKIVGKDVRTRFPKGAKIRLVQTTTKYFCVVAAAMSGSDTLITITGGSDYSLANAAIASPAYSYAATPQGFPQWFNWTPTFTGVSVSPQGTHRFAVSGKTVNFTIREDVPGTSNSTTFKMTAPITPNTGISNLVWLGACLLVNANVPANLFSRWIIREGIPDIEFGIDADTGGGFSGSGSIHVPGCEGFYEF